MQSSQTPPATWHFKHVKQHIYAMIDQQHNLNKSLNVLIVSHCECLSVISPEVKRQKSIPEDLKKAEEDRGSPTDLDIRRPFEEEVCHFLFPKLYLCLQRVSSHLQQLPEKSGKNYKIHTIKDLLVYFAHCCSFVKLLLWTLQGKIDELGIWGVRWEVVSLNFSHLAFFYFLL